jgi:PAP2 superfamily
MPVAGIRHPGEVTLLAAPDRPGHGRRLAALLLAVAVACALLVVALYRVFVRSATGQLVEIAAMGGHDVGRARVAGIPRILDVVSVSSVALALAVVVAVGLLRRRWRSSAAAVLLVGGSALTSELLKHRLLVRPDFGHGTLNSLPSGHTTVAASIAAVAVLVCPRRLRPVVALGGVAYAVATGLAVVAAGWHRPADVMAAYAVVLAWSAVCGALVVGLSPHIPGRPGAGHQAVALVLGAAGGVLGAVSALGTALVARGLATPMGEVRESAAYAAGTAGIVAGGLLTAALWLLVVPFVDSSTSVPPVRARPSRAPHSPRDQGLVGDRAPRSP